MLAEARTLTVIQASCSSRRKAGVFMVINGGFESGDFTGWATIGDASIQTASFGTGPKSGKYQAVVTNFNFSYPPPPLSKNASVSADQVELFLGLPTRILNQLSAYRIVDGDPGVTTGSAIRQSFPATAGLQLSIWYNFLTDDAWGNANDFCFLSLFAPGVPRAQSALILVILAGVESPAASSTSRTVLKHETGYRRFACSVPLTANYTLGLGVLNMRDNMTGSAIAVDDVQLGQENDCDPDPPAGAEHRSD